MINRDFQLFLLKKKKKVISYFDPVTAFYYTIKPNLKMMS